MSTKYTLGLNIGKVDSSASLFKGPVIHAHVEEERYTRVKKAINQFPINAIKYCLGMLSNGLEGVEAIVLGFDHDKFTLEVPKYYIEEWSQFPSKPKLAVNYEVNRLKEKHPKNVRNKLYNELESAGLVSNGYFPEVKWYSHHYCHAISAHLASPYENSLGIVVDANSEIDTVSVWDCKRTAIDKIYSKTLPHSLGWLYRSFTLFCGFDAYEGEGMLMGLAPYGKPNKEIAEKIEKILYWKTNESGDFEFGVDPQYVYLDERSKSNAFLTQRLIDTFGEPCSDASDPPQYYKDVAYEIQDRFEKTLQQFVQRFVNRTSHKYVTLSGGVFLNCKATGHIWRETKEIQDIYVVPTASDDGIGIGACMAYAIEKGFTDRDEYSLKDVYLGDSFTKEEILSTLDNFVIRNDFRNSKQYGALVRSLGLEMRPDDLQRKICEAETYEKIRDKVKYFILNNTSISDSISEYAASKIAEGKVIAWFQGGMEAGPRALGNRSILADPRSMNSLSKVNEMVKFRQHWRPFCPSVINEYADEYFKKTTQSPYMINTFEVTKKCEEAAPAIVHVDKTARTQFLLKDHNPKFYELLEAFRKIAGVPILMNTSMNIKGEPICRTPDDALNFFFATDVDLLVMDDVVIQK